MEELTKRVKKLEIVTARLLRRLGGSRVKAMITPYPVSNAVFGDDIKGPVLKYMFPCSGGISKGFIRLDKKFKEGVRVIVQKLNDLGGDTRDYIITRRSLLVEPKILVDPGDRLIVSIEPIGDEPVTEVWVSFLWRPTTKDIEIKSFLIEELESDISGQED